MNPQNQVGPAATPPRDEQPTLLHIAAVLLRRGRVIAVSVAACTALAIVAAVLWPRSWTAEVVMVPSSSGGDSRLQMLAAQLAIPGLGGLAGGGRGESAVTAIVQSRAVRDSVAQRALAGGIGPAAREALDRLLKDGTEVENDRVARAITIRVTTGEPELSRALASFFPSAVNNIASGIALEAAAQRRATVERQMDVAAANLRRSQQALLEFQERTGTPQIQEQARQAVAAAAELQRAITQQEIRVAQLERVSTPDNPELRGARAELGTLRSQLRKLATEGSEVLLAQGALPGMQLELAQRLRDYTKDEQIYTLLTAELAETQLDLNERLEVVSVLDAASLPETPSSPGRVLLVLLGIVGGVTLGVGLAFVIDYVDSTRRVEPDQPFFTEWNRLRKRGANRGGEREAARA